MKKLFTTVALVSAAMLSQAQIFVGGSLGFTSGSEKFKSDKVSKNMNLNVSPMVGYQINEKLAAGVRLGFNTDKTTTFDVKLLDETHDAIAKGNSFEVALFAQYTFLQFGKFSVYADASLGFGSTKNKTEWGTTKTDSKGSEFGLAVVPCLAYNLSEKISLITNLNFMSLNFDHSKSGDEKQNLFSVGVSDNVTRLANVSIGMIYKF